MPVISYSELSGMTVVELRKFAKDNQIKLGVATTKTVIVDRILESLNERQQDDALIGSLPASKPASASAVKLPAPVKRPPLSPAAEAKKSSDSDDEDDLPVMTVNRTPPPAPKPKSVVAPPPTAPAPKGNKPAFNLTGARAWHNPAPFTPTSPQQNKYMPVISTQAINTTQGGQQSAPIQRPVVRSVSRFGPRAEAETKATAPQPVAPPRPAAPPAWRPDVLPPLVEPHQDKSPDPFVSPAPEKDLPVVSEGLLTGDYGEGQGVLEIQPDGYGFLRAGNFLPGKNDIYVSNAQVRRFKLENGDLVAGKTRLQRDSDKFAALMVIESINGHPVADLPARRDFDDLTPTYPVSRMTLSDDTHNDMVLRLIDLFCPIGFGQRAMIVAPPKAGKTTILKKIALSVKHRHPDTHLMVLLVDERPEEVTDLKESVGGDIFYSTFDEPAESHVRVSELVLERAMRLVEAGRDVVILLDSLTRLSRAYNTLAPTTARVMSGGLVAGILTKPKRFFGAARKLKEGGSLSVIATALVDTGSRMDDVIFEEFKGTGNMEIKLDRALSEMRLFPAMSILKSGTRHDELLLAQEEREVADKVRNLLSGTSEQEGLNMILSMMEKTRDNADFVARFDNWLRLMRP